jgi:PadR family transcriptional regulator PadR
MADSKLDLMVLQTLETMGALHGYGIARRIEQLSQDQDDNRKAKSYSITKAGNRQVRTEKSNWERLAAVMGRVLTAPAGGNE